MGIVFLEDLADNLFNIFLLQLRPLRVVHQAALIVEKKSQNPEIFVQGDEIAFHEIHQLKMKLFASSSYDGRLCMQ